MKKVFHHNYTRKKEALDNIVANFDLAQVKTLQGKRNTIKLFNLNDEIINVKSFKTPNFFNQIVYKYFRKSKAQRSFEYAKTLLKLGIGTPQPIAYYENSSWLLFKKSYYISKQLQCDLTFRELIHDINYPNRETILRAFTRFTFNLHENGIHFLDHSPGNTLIVKNENQYEFYLVDLNRMNFGSLNFKTRINNFARLSANESMIAIMSNEYAKFSGIDSEKVFKLMLQFTQEFQNRFQRKKRLKMKLKLWKA